MPFTKLTYRSARIAESLGLRTPAIALFRAAIAAGGYERARRRLARLELPGEDYFHVLGRVHAHLKPSTYVEIGVFKGDTLKLVAPSTRVLGVDPEPRLTDAAAANVRIFAKTSDDFFAQHDPIAEFGGERIDMALIDGMHRFEFALRDFINLEKLCHSRSVIFVHDCYPLDEPSSERLQTPNFWSGDVWRMLVLLIKYRPDLRIHTLAAEPTGLGVIMNLDPNSRVLTDNYEKLVNEGMQLRYAALEPDKGGTLHRFPNDWNRIRALLDSRGAAA
jgi:Methyltransferase domain